MVLFWWNISWIEGGYLPALEHAALNLLRSVDMLLAESWDDRPVPASIIVKHLKEDLTRMITQWCKDMVYSARVKDYPFLPDPEHIAQSWAGVDAWKAVR